MIRQRLRVRGFSRNERGSVILIFALTIPVLLGGVGAAIDYGALVKSKSELRHAADSAVIAVVADMRVSNPTDDRINSVARSIVTVNLNQKAGDPPVVIKVEKLFRTGPAVNSSAKEPFGAVVTLTRTVKTWFNLIHGLTQLDISAVSSAELRGSVKVCVVGLDPIGTDVIQLKDQARIEASTCSVYANSTSPSSMRSEGRSLITSGKTCTAGGFAGSSTNYNPAPSTDCPRVPDPLADRQAPSVGGCNYNNMRLIGVTRTLSPGTYCGGLVVDKGAQVTLTPGNYIIKDGPLIVGPGGFATTTRNSGEEDDECGDDERCTTTTRTNIGYLRGTNVGFYFTGTVKPDSAGVVRPMRFMKDSVVEITAPKIGDLAGLLFFEDRNALVDRQFEVMSDSARRLVGTIYLSRGTFVVSANQTVADQSEYTAVVVKRLALSQAPRLVINTNYAGTDVPVPNGVGPFSAEISLVQ